MAEEFVDPREVAWHPRRRFSLHGHGAAEARLLQAFQSGKLHHAWLISGLRGIGKATLAYRFARFLAQPNVNANAASLHVTPESPTSHMLSAGAHPNIFVLQRSPDDKKKRLKSEIAVEDSREAIGFMNRTSATGGWRVVIVDPADDLNAASANALLKMVEEPPVRSIILIVCHQPGQLLRTIRSRCIHLPLDPLDVPAVLRVLHELPPKAVAADAEALQLAAELSGGSPGRALELIRSRGAAAYADFLRRPNLTPAACVEIGAAFTGRETAEDYAIFCDLLTGWVAAKTRDAALAGRGEALALAHGDMVYSLRQTDALNLDRRQTVTDALLRLGEALKAS